MLVIIISKKRRNLFHNRIHHKYTRTHTQSGNSLLEHFFRFDGTYSNFFPHLKMYIFSLSLWLLMLANPKFWQWMEKDRPFKAFRNVLNGFLSLKSTIKVKQKKGLIINLKSRWLHEKLKIEHFWNACAIKFDYERCQLQRWSLTLKSEVFYTHQTKGK